MTVSPPQSNSGSNTTPAALLPAPGFRLVRYFTVASFVAFVLVAIPLVYFERMEDQFHERVQQDQNAFFAQVQDEFARRHDADAHADLLRSHEAANMNLARLFANALWEKDFAPFVAKAQRIPADRCRAIADEKDAAGQTAQPAAKKACYAGIGRQIMAFPEFRALDAKVFDLMNKSTVFKIKVYDLRGITTYSSEHGQIGEDKIGNAGWRSAVAGKPASVLTHRDKFNAFEGVVENRDLIEIYLPVRAPGSEKIVAVFEVYSDVTQVIEQINAASAQIDKMRAENQKQVDQATTANQHKIGEKANQLLAIVIGLLVLLYCAMFLIVRNGQRVIDSQDSGRRRAELALLRQKDLYDVLSQTNKAIVHIVDRNELFATVCRIAVEHGRFRFAWIGLTGDGDQRLKPAARYGEDAGYIDRLDHSGDDGEGATKRGLTGRTLLSGSYVISNDFLNDPAMASWHEAARRAGVRASAKFPIRRQGSVIGAISLYAGEPGFFTTEVIATLDEVANDVSFALDHLAGEAERVRGIEALRQSEQSFHELFESNPHPMWVYDPQTLRFLEVNDAAVLHYGWSRAEFLAMTIADIRPAQDKPVLLEYLSAGSGAKIRKDDSWKHVKKDGTPIDVEITSHIIDFRGRRARIVSAHDITERKQADAALRAAAEQFRGVVEQPITGIYIVQDGKFSYVNPRLAEILGYDSADELIGRDALSVVAEKDRGIVAENIRQRAEGEVTSIGYSFCAQRKDGSMIDIGVHGAGATYRGAPAIIGLMQDITEKKRAEEQIQRYVIQLQNTFMRAVEIATTLSEMRDPYTAGHERRVGEIAAAIGAALGFDAHRVEGLRVAGYLHDVGKITIPAEILAKPGKITPIEFLLIKEHAQASYDILKHVEFPWPVAAVALQHHERMDGSGYPQGLKGEAILLEARIMAVADVVEAMSSHRPYRPGLGIDKALAEIERGRGTAYDPDAANACLRLFREQGYTIPA